MKRILKENPLSRLKKSMNGIAEGIYSFGIMTAQNPMGEKISNEENNKRQKRFKDYLRNGIYQYIFVKGKYGNLEDPIVILNINIDELLYLGDKFEQESVIFARNYFDYVEFQYWQQKGKGDFELLDTSDYYVNLEDPEDFYTYKKTWKFNIPFSIFEEMNKSYASKYRDLKEDTLQYIERLNKRIVEEENKTIKHYRELRGRINFFLKEQPVRLMNRDLEKFKEAGITHTGYWFKYGDAYEVERNHIRFILDKPEMFEFTKEELRDIYRSYGEKIGQEGKAREHIIKEAARRGWVRIRHYKKPSDYWSIQFDRYKKRRRSVEKFIDYALENLGMDMYDAIALVGYDDGYSKEYTFREGGVGEYLVNERNKRKPKKVI